MVCSMWELSLQEKVSESVIIVEAEVVRSEPFWDKDRHRIYTRHFLQPRQFFKGSLQKASLCVITQGGQVEGDMQTVHPALTLKIGDRGIFFLSNINIQGIEVDPNHAAYLPFGDAQGLIKYDELQGLGSDLFHVFPEIANELYPALEALTGQKAEFWGTPAWDLQDENLIQSGKTTAISTFSPTTVSAGTGTILTINGTNFLAYDGGTTSTVFFRNADDGGASFVGCPASEIISWTTTQIRLRVPNGAGTGTFVVRNSSGTTFTSPSILTIDFNHTNVTFGGNELRPILRNKNGSGGYSFQRSTNTANSGVNFNTSAAVTPFDNALTNWQCNTGFNFTDPGTTTTSSTQDPNTNPDIAMFDNAATPLSAGVLGVAISGFSSCDGITWFVNGVDIVFRRNGTGGITWNFGPGATTGCCVDFESVALHELGHAHQLGHIISAGRVMHFSIGPGQDQRVLNATSDIAGGNFVMAQSLGATTCGGSITGMTPFNCILDAQAIALEGYSVRGQGNVLEWSAPEMAAGGYFVVERSADGHSFSPISEIPAHQPSEKWQPYQYIDQQDLLPELWYRLQIRQSDGTLRFSETLRISVEAEQPQVQALFPQPFQQELTIQFSAPLEGKIQASLMDLSGKIILQAILTPEGRQLRWECGPMLPAGMYILQLTDNELHYSQKVIRN